MTKNSLPNSPKINLLFFGSFLNYSQLILKKLTESDQLGVMGVVTIPPQPSGRKLTLQKTPVHLAAKKLNLPVFTPSRLSTDSLAEIQQQLGQIPDLIVTAGYGKLLPIAWLNYPRLAALNLHFSLLPKY